MVRVLQPVKDSNQSSNFMDRSACSTKSQKRTIMAEESNPTIPRMRERMLPGTLRNLDSRFRILTLTYMT